MSQTVRAVFAEVLAPSDLRLTDILAWREMQGDVPAFANPLFGWDFSAAVAQVRDDARVAVWRDAERLPVAFMAFHKRPGGLARPIAAPFSDYHGIVSKGDIGVWGAQALSLAGISTLRATGLVDPFGLFERTDLEDADSYLLEVTGSAEDYIEALRAESPKRFKNYRRLQSKLEREVGPLRFVTAETDPAVFETVLRWKREQFHRTGLQDVLRPAWVDALMRGLFEQREGTLRGKLAALYAGDTLVTAHFGVRQNAVFHPWIASSNPDLADYSPGQLFLLHAIRSMPEDGLEAYDLAAGHDHYKRPFAPLVRQVGRGLISTGRPPLSERLGPAPMRKVMRRLDHIAAMEPGFAGRVRGFAEAAAAAGRRGFGNHPSSEGVA